jgi:hypothetical protein
MVTVKIPSPQTVLLCEKEWKCVAPLVGSLLFPLMTSWATLRQLASATASDIAVLSALDLKFKQQLNLMPSE